jgi:hypothetical protein
VSEPTLAEEVELFLRLQHKPCLICGGDHLTEEGHQSEPCFEEER